MKTTINDEGVILHLQNYKENDAIIQVYFKEYGKLSFIGKGVKKMTSKNASGLHLMGLSQIEGSISTGLGSITRATPINYYRHIQEDFVSESIGQYLLEYYYRYEQQNEPDLDKYKMLTTCLDNLNNGYSPLLVLLIFQAFILKSNGIHLNVDECVVCGNKQVNSIHLVEGGFVCGIHQGNMPSLSKETLILFRRLHKLSIEHIDEFKIDNVDVKTLVLLQDTLLKDNCGVHFNTMKFVTQIL